MRIRFWWTRGSLATPGPTTLRYGGNTSCVEVRTADGTLIVLDCGTGAHGLGRALAASGERPVADRERATAAPTDGAARSDVLDRGTLRRLGEELDGVGALREVIATFLAGTPEFLAALRNAATPGDAPGMRHAAHTLKSSSAMLGALALSAPCAEIEQLSRRSLFPDADARVGAIERLYATAKLALEAEAANPG